MQLPGISTMMIQGSADLIAGLNVVASPARVSKAQGFGDGATHTLTTAAVTATASGGVGPYTYATDYLSGDLSISATSPTGASTAFTATLSPDDGPSAIFRITATDTATGGKAHCDVTVTLHYVDTR